MNFRLLLRTLAKSKEVAKLLKIVYHESRKTRIGLTLTRLSNQTKIERHKLVGIIEVLSVLGILIVAQFGMAKVVAINPETAKLVREAITKV